MDPFPTTEARWFLRGSIPAAAAAWFEALGAPVEPESRTDRYLRPTSDGLGVKVREGSLETKRREDRLGPLGAGASAGAVESWVKWSFDLAAPADPETGWVAVGKTRRQRQRRVAGGVCSLELAEVTAGGETWWSVCLEAFGRTAGARRDALDAAARAWLDRPDAPALPAEASMGYAAWLMGLPAPPPR